MNVLVKTEFIIVIYFSSKWSITFCIGLQINTKLSNVRISDKKVVITFVAIVVPRKLISDVCTTFFSSEFGIF